MIVLGLYIHHQQTAYPAVQPVTITLPMHDKWPIDRPCCTSLLQVGRVQSHLETAEAATAAAGCGRIHADVIVECTTCIGSGR